MWRVDIPGGSVDNCAQVEILACHSVGHRTDRITMSYDGKNRLQVYQSTGAPTTYAYSGDGLKRLEIAGSAITTLVWDGTDYLQAR